ncbi:olfactory receptor 6N2-like [Pelobates fuscus]|uniref:olfactory receptor 6N2-like n=1 Tax=Pelobates fuscus TaxID=191477 RepID=UPI002FE4E0C1
MDFNNRSQVTEFIILGFPTLNRYGPFIFPCLLLVYLLTIFGNLLVLVIIRMDLRLHTPMYFFISVLSFLELCYTATTIPTMLINLLVPRMNISFIGCLSQIYFFHALGSSECYLLTSMAYDRYMAISHPLHYQSIMTPKMTIQMVSISFTCGFICPIAEIILISKLSFCGVNEIHHIICDLPPVLNSACTETTVNVLVDFATNSLFILLPFFFIMISYAKIIIAILKISTKTGRAKAFSTCVSHLSVVLVFFTCIVFMYVRLTKSYSLYYDRVLAVIYSVLTPIFNPIVYSLRNKEIRMGLRRVLC